MWIEHIFSKSKSDEKVKGSEKPLRSLMKALSWRAFGTLDTMLIAWLISGNLAIAFSIGSVELITKTFLYFFHERMWNYIKWGKLLNDECRTS